jgi:hypothetical protein
MDKRITLEGELKLIGDELWTIDESNFSYYESLYLHKLSILTILIELLGTDEYIYDERHGT